MTQNQWPKQSELLSYYGNPAQNNAAWQRANLVYVNTPFAMHFEKFPVHRFMAHKKVAQSVDIVLRALWEFYKHDQAAIDAAHVSSYSGCYNFRSIRGSNNLSLHAFGAAIDFDAEHNPMCYAKGKGFFQPNSPIVTMFKSQGWFWGGDYCVRKDPMHFEAVSR